MAKLHFKENQDIEYKQNWRDEYLKWICAFANGEGGTLYIGVNDKGEIVGINNSKKLLEDIPNKARDILGVVIDIKMKSEEEKEYLEIKVESYPYPVSYKGQYHLRSGSSKQELKGAALDKFLLAKQGKKWDGVPVPFVNIDDLDKRAFDLFREKAEKKKRVEVDFLNENDNNLIEKLNLVDGDYLKRAAILLFHKDPEKFVTGSCIKIGYFKTDSELLYHDMVTGNIIEQVDKTIDLIFTKYLKAYISYEGIQRVESFPISKMAFREALINAVVHKDYGELTPIQISVYDNKLMIWNTGELPPNWTVKTLKQKHSSKPYNPTIAYVFFLAGFIESWGRGIDKIIKESESFNNITPSFKYDSGLWVEFEFRMLEKMSGKMSGKIVELIQNNSSITIPEMASIVGVTERTIRRKLQNLQENNILKRVGGRKEGTWMIIERDK